jgi:hypothetical protein
MRRTGSLGAGLWGGLDPFERVELLDMLTRKARL